MSFSVVLNEKRNGKLIDRLDDPRGHLSILIRLEESLGLGYLSELDPHDDHVFEGARARDLGNVLRRVRSLLTVESVEAAKRAEESAWKSTPQGARERLPWLQTVTLESMILIVEKMNDFATRTEANEELQLVLYGD